ncbi:MAG: hypothetical protein DYG98_11915 [Haliscomenobacteraceae bacterium CHB4]|nr:hypothetical protein [Saprospiraceae bacterium]MCE7923755.1 hypothetical protein [Haliscomenobacteraceae bacterium CHB4]
MNRSLFAFCCLLCIFSQTACFEPKEGCLDIEATNFDASADKDCCCEYPQLIVEALHRYGSDSVQYVPDALYENNAGQLFRIKSVAFYLSEIQLFQNGGLLAVADTVHLRTYAPGGGDTLKEVFTDDFLLLRRTPVDNPVGEFRPAGTFEKVRIRLGLSPDAQRVIPRLAPAGSPLRIQGDSLWYGPSAGYVFFQAVVVRDSMQATKPDTLAFTQSQLPDFFIEKTGNYLHPSGGYDFRLKLGIDYQKMFDGIDWSNGDISAWKSQIALNLPGVFSVSQ